MPKAEEVSVTNDTLPISQMGARFQSRWPGIPDLSTLPERDDWEFIGGGQGIHWPDLDEDLSVEGLIMGRPSGEGQRSFKRWLEAKQAGRSVALYDLKQAD